MDKIQRMGGHETAVKSLWLLTGTDIFQNSRAVGGPSPSKERTKAEVCGIA